MNKQSAGSVTAMAIRSSLCETIHFRTAVHDRIPVRDWLLPLRRLLVGLDVEIDEEAEIAREQGTAEKSSAFRSSASSKSRIFAGSVCGDEIRIC